MLGRERPLGKAAIEPAYEILKTYPSALILKTLNDSWKDWRRGKISDPYIHAERGREGSKGSLRPL